MLATWIKHECPSSLFVFKGDDDTLVNPFELEKLMTQSIEANSEGQAAIYGSILETQPVDRHSTKYGDDLWPSAEYPTYVSGGGFLMNKVAMDNIQEN